MIMGGKDAVYEMCKGVVKKYRLDRAIPCDLVESKSMKKMGSK